MKECPKCGYIESLFWRPAFVDIERDVIEAENLQHEDNALFKQLVKGRNIVIGNYAYRLTKTGKWVERLYLPIFNSRNRSFSKPKQYNGAVKAKGMLEASLRANGMIPLKDSTLDRPL